MNTLELQMVSVLKKLREEFGAETVKGEFEVEGTRIAEAMRFKDVASAAGIGITIKLGGGEAIRDMYDCQLLGVKRVVAPMIESAFAMQRFLGAATKIFKTGDGEAVDLVVNVESITGIRAFQEMVAHPMASSLDGVVVGRGDVAGSLGRDVSYVDSEEICELTRGVMLAAKARGWDTTIGGGVTADSLPFFRSLPEGTLDRYDVRKIIFGCPAGLGPRAAEGLNEAVRFELLWLQNKRNYYQHIAGENRERLALLEARFN